jgi:mono/diheme cytochrome c family protein
LYRALRVPALAALGGLLGQNATPRVDFETQILPIFAQSCLQCHGPKAQMGQLRLDDKRLAIGGGLSKRAIVPGDSAASTLYQRVAGHGDQARMPMGGQPLSSEQIALIKHWIDGGASWPDSTARGPASIQKHWAYVAPVQAPLPAVKNTAWAAQPIDRWVMARLEKEALNPSAPADKTTLLRRLSLDLIGLPPSPEEVEMRETHLLLRGDFLKPGKVVDAGTPSFLHAAPQAPMNRLAFAKWLTDRQSPTVARSIVNRIWQSYFGTGIVATSEDLGRQSEPPSHPELLDWLSVDLMENGWSLKRLHRNIVTSNTYQQSSRVTPELLSKDPYNRLLARGPRFRVEAEAVRDIALAASGLLTAKVGGPSVFPPAPDFLFLPPASYGPKNWYEEKGPERYRRALYTFRFRSVPYPMLQAFDAPNGDMSCVRRSRSNSPLQALTTLNEPLFLETARALAMKTLREGGANDTERLRYAFRRVLSRRPSEKEADTLLTLLASQTRKMEAPGRNPWEFAANDPAAPPALPAGVTPAQAAGWTAVARVLLNLDETITKE